MTEFNNYKLLSEMVTTLKSADIVSTNCISSIRHLIKEINNARAQVLSGDIELTEQDIDSYQLAVDNAICGDKVLLITDVKTTATIETFQLDGSIDDVNLEFNQNSTIPPEHGTIIQKLWKIGFKDSTTGHSIVSDTSDVDLSALFNAQLSTALSTAPLGSVEDLDITISLEDLREIILINRNISSLINGLEKPGLIPRQLRDIDIDLDPELQSLTEELKNKLKNAIETLNFAVTDEKINNAQIELQTVATDAGLYSTSIGPTANGNYSDLKKFRLQKDGNNIVDVILSMPVVSWDDPNDPIAGIPLRDSSGPKNKTNRKDNGKSYIVDLGGIDPVIRNGRPNPLPATRYYNNGPPSAVENEGALERYNGGKCLGMNTTDTVATFKSFHKEKDGEITVTVPPMSAIWKLDRATFDLGNKHAYYTVFSASRPPPSGFMGVVFAPKQNRLGRGRGEIASGATLANGISKTGKTFNKQDEDGPNLDDNNNEIPSGLTGLTSHFDGHGLNPVDLLKFLQDNSFTKGTQYLTIPADASIENVEDVLIPAGQFVPQITQAVGTLLQFSNGTFIKDGGPARFQPGLIPFFPGTIAYTPEWHINWIIYNCGEVECDGNIYPIENPALDNTQESWIKPIRNPSFGPPGPNPNNSQESGFSQAFPDTFDPVQLRCNIKWSHCEDYVNKIEGSENGEISLSMLSKLEQENKIFFTEAPAGAMRGWVKFLIVNCPLPIVVTVDAVGNEIINFDPVPENLRDEFNPTPGNSGTCNTCTCDRTATTVSINGDLIPIFIESIDNGNDVVIGDRILKFKVGDNIVIRATSGTVHGVSLRLDNMLSNTTLDTSKTLQQMQSEVLTEIKEKVIINNEEELENNITAMTDDLINFHGGIPITFTQKATTNPFAFPDGVIIANLTIKEGAESSSGSIGCTVHGSSMSFKFTVCPL
jgi:hypothetical protein